MKICTAKKASVAKTVVKTCAKKVCARKATKKEDTKSVVFTVHAEKGKNVFLAGEFNSWNPQATKMTYKAANGIYTASVKLAKGTYQYKFIIDGTWCADPENTESVPNDQGTFNSVIHVM